jgi:ribosomal protein S6
MKQNYELSYLISSQASEGAWQEISRKTNDFIQAKEGVILESQLPQRISLAYPVKKENAAWFQTTYFSLDSSKLEDLQKKLKEEKGILRFLLLVKRPVKISARRARKSKEAMKKFVPSEIKKTGTSQQKVELKEIEKKLEEILNKGDELK